MKTTRCRFFSDFYDSVSQRAYPDICQRYDCAKDLYFGRLRFDALLSESIVLTDAQVLDGQLFNAVEPNVLAQRLARSDRDPMPIEIRSRAQKLEDALLLFFKRPGADKLRGLALSVVNDESTRSEIKKRLEVTDADKIRSWRDIPGILRDIGVPEDDIQRIESGWAHWIEAQGEGLVRVVKWQGDFQLDQALGDRSALANCLDTADARELIGWIYEHRADRNTVDRKLADLRREWDGPRLVHLDTIETWFNEAYNLALAWQHGCDNFESIYSSLASVRVLEEKGIGRWTVVPEFKLDLPSEFIQKLGTMPDGTFRQLFWKHKEIFTRWWSYGDMDSLRKAIERFTDEIYIASGEASLSMRQKLETGVLAALIAYKSGGSELSSIITGIVGTLLPDSVQYLKERSHKRPARQTLQRVMQIADERKTR